MKRQWNIRNAYSLSTLRLSTLRTGIRALVVGRVTDVAYVVDTAPRFLESPLGYQPGRLDVTGVAIGVFVGLVRCPRTLLAADMLARLALLGSRCERSIARMTGTSNPLADRFADEILSACARRQRERCIGVAGQLEIRVQAGAGAGVAGPNLGHLELGYAQLFLALVFLAGGGREPRAFLAAGVLAVDADLVRAEGRLTPVAGAAHSHADRLGHPCQLEVGGRLPLAGFQGQTVLGEQGAGLFLLHAAVVGEHGWFSGSADRGCCWRRSTIEVIFSKNANASRP